ncbi:MAG: hypothetical protein ACXWC9_04585 [Pseudobdellovibrionaceae bacterium]
MRKAIKAMISLATLIGFAMIFQNCGQTPLGVLGFNAEEQDSTIESEQNSESVSAQYALLSSDQVFKSMASVTGIAPNTTITNEYNQVSLILSSGYDLRSVNSPMMIGSANLASRFCNEMITQTDARDRFYPGIDFAKGIETNDGSLNLTDEAYQTSIENMSQAFWGRSPSSEEFQAFAEAKDEFLADYTPAERRAVNSSTRLMLFTCTAMLVSFDAMSF